MALQKKKTREDLRKFAISFDSEVLLQQAMAGLLTRIPNVTGVQILQGPQEYGKDIIFYIPGGVGEQILCACVVKNCKISGDAARSTGARTILHQAQQALDTPHVDENGRTISVERIYVVTPFDIPPPTINSVAGALRRDNTGLVFIGGSNLFELFRRYWPEYFVRESVALAHLKSTSEEITRESALTDIAFQYNLGPVEHTLNNIYVYPVFTRAFRSYDLRINAADIVPTASSLANGITKRDAASLAARLRAVSNFCQTAAQWGLCSSEHANELTKSVEQFCELLPRDTSSTTADSKQASPKISFRSVKHVVIAAKRLTAACQIATKSLRQLTIDSRHALTLSHQDALGPNYAVFAKAARLNEFAASSSSDLIKAKKETETSFTLSGDILNCNHSLMIAAPAGYGKTSFCRWHALKDAENFSTGRSQVIPVYVALHSMPRQGEFSFEESCLGHLGQSALLSRTGAANAAERYDHIRLYLDGLDEIPSAKRRHALMEAVRSGLERYPHIQLVLAARDYVYGSWLSWLPRLYISPFTPTQIGQLVSNWFGSESPESQRFINQLALSPTLENVMRTPLLATLTILVYRQTGRLPENRVRLYEMFVELLSGGWDLAKGVQRGSKFGSAVKLIVLKRLAYRVHKQGGRQFGQVDLATTVRSSLSDSALSRWEELTEELLQDGLLVRAGKSYEFSHQSFQEFLAAKALLGDPAVRRAQEILEAYLLGDSWWTDAMGFYVVLGGQPREMVDWIESTVGSLERGAKNVRTDHRDYLIRVINETFPEIKTDVVQRR